MANRVRWDQYEAVILLDAYVKFVDGQLTRSQAIERVSSLLRKRAILAGETIDDSYRNEAGISFQLGVMQFVMTDGKKGIGQKSKLFQDTVNLYRSNPSEFASTLQTALRLSESAGAAIHLVRPVNSTASGNGGQTNRFCHVNNNNDPLVDAIRKRGIKFTDERSIGGCLWIIGGNELAGFVYEMRKLGARFYFEKNGTRTIGGRSGWWTKDYACKQPAASMTDFNGITSTVDKPEKVAKVKPLVREVQSEQASHAAEFRRWMMQHGLAESSARSYSSAINSAEQFAREHGYADVCFYGNGDAHSVRQMIDRLFSDEDFVAYNEGQHNRFRTALRKYLDFVGGGSLPEIRPIAHAQDARVDTLSTDVRDALLDVVSEGFPNGVRLGSIIDRKRIARLYKEKTGSNPPEDDEVERCLSARGVTLNGKLYLIESATKQAVRERLEEEKRKGHRIFYYEELYNASADFYTNKMIYASDALRRVIEECGIQLVFYKNYCATTRDVTIEDELMRAFDEKIHLTVDELKERLPFIPESKLTPSLSLSRKFVRVRVGEYARVSGIEINMEDVPDARALVEDEIAKHGFASLGNIDLTRTLGDNPLLSETAIRDAFFVKVLAHEYSKKGQIITRTGESASANDVMRESCKGLTRATLEELDDLEKFITGQVRNTILPIAFETMVRTDRDLFVSDELVDFDIKAVDDALDFFVGESIAPIKAVSSFNSFPYVGQPWTLYLLESYVSRFSRRYKISGGPARTDNVGALYPSELVYSNYGELLAHVLADSKLDLNGDEAADYLIKVGFVLRKTALVRTAIERARTLRDIEGR